MSLEERLHQSAKSLLAWVEQVTPTQDRIGDKIRDIREFFNFKYISKPHLVKAQGGRKRGRKTPMSSLKLLKIYFILYLGPQVIGRNLDFVGS
jgi:hypothetical protein